MLATKILFILVILICAAFYILYVWNFSLVLLIVFVTLPVLMFLTSLISKLMLKADFAVKEKTSPKNSDFSVQLCVANRGIIPVGRAEACIEYYNIFNNKISSFEMGFPIQALNTQRITFQLSSRYCGVIKIRTAYIRITDPLHLFSFKACRGVNTEIAVIPEAHEIGGSVSITDRVNEESEMFSENRPGDDPSEVFDLRDYIPGDKLNRIHWKLSSKKDDLIVKDYSLPVDVPSLVFLDLKCYEDSEYTLPLFDTLIDSLVSVSQFMLENERPHRIVYYNAKKGDFDEIDVLSPEVLPVLVRKIIFSIKDNLFCELPEKYFSTEMQTQLSSFTFITSSKKTTVLEYIDDETDADFKNAVVVVSSPAEAAAVPDGYSSLHVIPVVIGRITAGIRDIEL